MPAASWDVLALAHRMQVTLPLYSPVRENREWKETTGPRLPERDLNKERDLACAASKYIPLGQRLVPVYCPQVAALAADASLHLGSLHAM